MKICERSKMSGAKKCLRQEINAMKMLGGHPNIIQLFEVIETPSHVVLVMEFGSGGDLHKFVRRRRRLTEPCAQDLMKQLLDGLSFCHGRRVVHRDLKLENLLLDAYGCLKIADFGVAATWRPGTKLRELCGTPSYMAPEVLAEAGYEGPPADLWSAGIVAYAMLCGKVPYRAEGIPELKREIVSSEVSMPAFLTEQAVSLIKGLLAVDPAARTTLPKALDHCWLESVANRAEAIYSLLGAPQSTEASGQGPPPQSERPVASESATHKALLSRAAGFGFQEAHVDESLREGILNQATATFRFVTQQAVRHRASKMPASQTNYLQDVPADDR